MSNIKPKFKPGEKVYRVFKDGDILEFVIFSTEVTTKFFKQNDSQKEETNVLYRNHFGSPATEDYLFLTIEGALEKAEKIISEIAKEKIEDLHENLEKLKMVNKEQEIINLLKSDLSEFLYKLEYESLTNKDIASIFSSISRSVNFKKTKIMSYQLKLMNDDK